MIKPLSLYIGLRYTRAKKRSQFVSFISLASMIGIMLGVAVLITVLSVMNGFDSEITHRFFAIAPQVTVFTSHPQRDNPADLQAKVASVPGVKALAPFVSGKGMLSHAGQVSGAQVIGITPALENNISSLGKKMLDGELATLTPGSFHAVLGIKLATSMGLRVGDKLVLLTPQTTVSPLGISPRYRQLTVSGIYHVGGGFGFDNGVIYMNRHDASRLFAGGDALYGWHVTLKNIYDATPVSNTIALKMPNNYFVSNWTQTFGAFFKAIAMEKSMMFVILCLIVAVAAFNLVSSLVMAVNDKQADIAILRTLGANRSTIMGAFIIQGAMIGLIGTLLGIVLGLLLAENATAVVNGIEHLFHVQLIPASVYFIDFLPTKIEVSDIWHIGLMAFVMSLLATLYPAKRAFNTQPAEALRYE